MRGIGVGRKRRSNNGEERRGPAFTPLSGWIRWSILIVTLLTSLVAGVRLLSEELRNFWDIWAPGEGEAAHENGDSVRSTYYSEEADEPGSRRTPPEAVRCEDLHYRIALFVDARSPSDAQRELLRAKSELENRNCSVSAAEANPLGADGAVVYFSEGARKSAVQVQAILGEVGIELELIGETNERLADEIQARIRLD